MSATFNCCFAEFPTRVGIFVFLYRDPCPTEVIIVRVNLRRPVRIGRSHSTKIASTTKSLAKRVFIFDSPRNRSHVFFRLISTHPEIQTHYHPYVNAGCLGPDEIHRQILKSHPERQKFVDELWELNVLRGIYIRDHRARSTPSRL